MGSVPTSHEEDVKTLDIPLLEQQLLDVKQRKSFTAFTHICKGYEAAPFQAVSVLLWLYKRKGLFRFDPGMGKTYASALAITALSNKEPDTKVIFLIKKSQITQTANDIRLYTRKRVVTCTGEKAQIERLNSTNPDNYDVLMLTHEALQSDKMGFILAALMPHFNMCVVDEAQFMTNSTESDRITVLAAICKRLPYVAFLTATPFISKSKQFASLLHLMDCDTFPRTDLLSKSLDKGGRPDLLNPFSIYSYDRKSEGIENTYNVFVDWVDPHDFQKEASGNHLLRTLRGEGSYNQLEAMKAVLRKQALAKKKGIVYIYYHDTREWVLQHLDDLGLRYDCIHGETPQAERDRVQREFQDGELDVVITSVTTSINLDCDYIYFYQYTLEIKQIVGRGERGLNPKVLELYFQFTRHTGDAQFFLDNVYMLSQKVRSWIGVEYTEFLQLGGELMNNIDLGEV